LGRKAAGVSGVAKSGKDRAGDDRQWGSWHIFCRKSRGYAAGL